MALFPYEPGVRTSRRGSGIFWESLALGLVMVLPRDSHLAREVEIVLIAVRTEYNQKLSEEQKLENRIGEEGEGFKIAMFALENGRYTVAAGATGLIRACLDASAIAVATGTALSSNVSKSSTSVARS